MKQNLFCFLLIFLLLLSFCSCGKSDKVKATPTDGVTVSETENENTTEETTAADEMTTTEPVTVTLDDSSTAALDAICKKYSVTGASVAVIKNGALNSVFSYGDAVKNTTPVCEDTKYRVASLSKLVTDIVFMQLADRGIVDPHENIEKYMGCSVRNPHYPDRVITAEMLMSHSSSVVDSEKFLQARFENSSVPISDLLSSSSTYAYYAPGEGCTYSNFGVAVVGAACEKVTQRCFDDLAREYLFEPLGIDASYTASGIKKRELLGELYGYGGWSTEQQLGSYFCGTPGQTYHIVQGNLTVSAKDLAKILCLLMNDGIDSKGNRLLSSKAVAEIKAEHYNAYGTGMGYGLQIQNNVIGNRKVYLHTGSNFGMFSAFLFSDEPCDGIVVLTSGADGTKDYSTEVYNVCLDIIRCILA